ncbi:MAG: hypothetical protein M1132_01045 [Chloroflexi bacterium]|nr:hypothetical protein [Chloroflexota bacterium]MCL5950305.1 hypothetical protein [Chloroflexota bacterium]
MYTGEGEIIQLLPAVGWQALYGNPSFDDCYTVPLVTWALVKMDDGKTDVVGLVLVEGFAGEMVIAELGDYFMNFLGPGEDPPDGNELAEALESLKSIFKERDIA